MRATRFAAVDLERGALRVITAVPWFSVTSPTALRVRFLKKKQPIGAKIFTSLTDYYEIVTLPLR